MSKTTPLKILAVFIALILLGSAAYFITQKLNPVKEIPEETQNQEERIADEESELSLTSSSTSSEELATNEEVSNPVVMKYPPSTKLNVEAYIADFAFTKGFNVVKANPKSFKTITPVWYSLDPNATDGLVTRKNVNDKNLLSFAKTNNIEIIPSISQFDFSQLSTVLNDQKKLDSHINKIVKVTVDNGYAGIDLDYENVKEGEKELYEGFIENLYKKLKAKNKKLVVTVLAKDFGTENATPTRRNQDWSILAKNADTIRIMVYDFKNPYRPSYAVTPIYWMENVVMYAQEKIPNDKISIGLPLYGYRYQNNADKSAVTYSSVQNYLKNRTIISNVLDDETKEKLLTYTTEGKEYEVWYTDKDVDKARRDRLKEFGIKNIFYWRLGDEDPAIHQQ